MHFAVASRKTKTRTRLRRHLFSSNLGKDKLFFNKYLNTVFVRCGDVLLAILKHDVPLSSLLKLAPSVLRESRSCVDPKAEAAGFKAIKVLNQISSKKKLTSETPEEDVPQLVALIETSLSYSRKYSKINLQQALSNLCKWAVS